MGVIAAIIGTVGYLGIANISAKNFYLKIGSTSHGIGFVEAGKSGKTIGFGSGRSDPILYVNKGDTVTIHIINEAHGEKYDLVIPELNVHSKPLGYFETDTVTFVAYKEGEFTFSSTSHPEVKGTLVVQ